MKNIKGQLKEIANLREIKGKEEETLEKIKDLVPKVKENKKWKELATLFWEAHLVWQHKAMTEMNKVRSEVNQKLVKESADKMLEFAKKAKDVIEEQNLDDMAGGAYRFLGRASTYLEDHEGAREYYEEAISRYSGKNEKSKLEVRGFLAESLVRLGEAEKGLELAKETYDDFYNSKLGKKLKEDDYFVWAVWMSGIIPRVARALIETEQDFNKEEIKELLEETKEELKNPSGKVTWGDDKFQFRVDEINYVLEQIS